VNQYESQIMSELLREHGCIPAENTREADICIVNSCTVTATGDAKCRKLMRRIRRENPAAVLVLCGCMPQAFADQPEVFSDCDIVMGNTARRDIVPILEEFFRERRQIIRIDPHTKDESFEPMRVSSFEERTRAFVKIEDGCNRFCTYCIIPYARGRVRSKPVVTLCHEAVDLALNGYREIVLVGINLSAYGQDIGADIFDAVHAVCTVPGIERVRLGSIEPERMTREMLTKLAEEEKFCPHFHLSLQSGCDETLRRMRRHYDTAEYARIVADIRELFENPAVTTDVMVGFVGETEDEFAASLAFCDRIGFAKAHVFPYSIRKGTVAERMEGHIDEHLKHVRADIMIEHTLQSQRAFMQSQVGRRSSVLIESTDALGVSEGYTPNYTKVKIHEPLPSGCSVDVIITDAHDDYCDGEVVR
jgi:threonylcarbamoyladenosine tRNA methylthiotransferase MtaB